MLRYYDVNVNVGGPIKKDKVWWHFSWRRQFNAVEQPLFTFDQSFDTWNQNPSAKVTYQVNQKNKIIGYYQWNMKEQPNRLPIAGYTYTDPSQTSRQVSPSWVYKAEWNGTVSDRLYLEARWGDFGYYDPRYSNSDEEYFWRDTTQLVLTGAHAESQTDRDRKQLTGAATYFLDTKFGSHTFKFGGEIYNETQWSGRAQNVGGNIEHIYSNGVSSQLVFGVPTATCVCGRYASDDGQLLVVNKLDQQDFFVNDTWSKGRVTMNLGLRWDRYKGLMPEQSQPAFTNGPVSVPAQTFAGARLLHLEQPRPAHRPDLRSRRRRQDGGEGELRTVLAQPGSGRQRRRQPEPEQQERHLHLERSQRRSPLSRWVRSRRTRPRRRWPARFSSIRTSPRRTRTTRRSTSNARSATASARASASSTRPKTI